MFVLDLPRYQVVWPLPELEANEHWWIWYGTEGLAGYLSTDTPPSKHNDADKSQVCDWGTGVLVYEWKRWVLQVRRSTVSSHPYGCTPVSFAMPTIAGTMPCFAWGQIDKVSSRAFKIWQRSSSPNFPAISWVIARAMTCNDGEDVCGCSMVMIDSVTISAALVEDVEQQARSSTGYLIAVT